MFILFIFLVIFRYRGTVASRPPVNVTMAEALESLYTTGYVTTALHAKSSFNSRMCHLTWLEQCSVDIMILGYTGSWKWNLSTGYHKIKIFTFFILNVMSWLGEICSDGSSVNNTRTSWKSCNVNSCKKRHLHVGSNNNMLPTLYPSHPCATQTAIFMNSSCEASTGTKHSSLGQILLEKKHHTQQHWEKY